MTSSPRRSSLLPLVLLMFVSEGVCISFLSSHWYQSQDMIAYPIRVVEYVEGWHAGRWFPRWASDLYGGYGSPLFNFYAPGLTVLAGPFFLLGCAPAVSLKIALVVLTMAGAAGMYFCARQETARDDAAFIAGICFAFMPYRYCQLYFRGDLSEYAAISLVPWTFYFYRRLGYARLSELPWTMVGAALTLAAVVMSHTITGQWTTELAVVIMLPFIWRWLRERNRPRLTVLFAALSLGSLLTAVYSIPALFEQRLVHIERMTEGPWRVAENTVDPTWLLDAHFFYAGYASAASILVALIAALTQYKRRSASPLLGWALLTAALFFMQLKQSAPIWSLLPLGHYIMFPWRLLGFIAVVGAICASVAWSAVVQGEGALRWLLAIVVAAAVIFDGQRAMIDLVPMSPAEIPSTPKDIANRIESTVVFNEYLPRPHDVPPSEPAVKFGTGLRAAQIEFATRGPNRFSFDVVASEPNAQMRVETFCYPGWTLRTRSGPAPAALSCDPAGYLRVVMPTPGHYHLNVYFGSTPLRTAASLISLTALGLLGYAWARARRLFRMREDVADPT